MSTKAGQAKLSLTGETKFLIYFIIRESMNQNMESRTSCNRVNQRCVANHVYHTSNGSEFCICSNACLGKMANSFEITCCVVGTADSMTL